MIDEVAEVVAGHGPVVVNLAVLAFGRGPFFPAVALVEDVSVPLAFKRSFVGFVLLQPVQVFREEEPGGLLGIVQFGGAAGLFPEDVVDVLEGLFKHTHPSQDNRADHRQFTEVGIPGNESSPGAGTGGGNPDIVHGNWATPSAEIGEEPAKELSSETIHR